MTDRIRIDRHDGHPIQTLDEVRRDHNVVGAYRDVEAARRAILDLERAGVEPRSIALLGAWPIDDPEGRERPVHIGRTAALAGMVGAAAGVGIGLATGTLVERVPVGFAIAAGAGFGAVLGGWAGWIRATGMSRAWRQTFAADDSGTVAVGVHDDDPTGVDVAAAAMDATDTLAMNRF